MENGKKTVKDFFAGLFKKYPDRAKKDQQKFARVYAGPDDTVRTPDAGPAEEDEPELVEVYAGPEFFERNASPEPDEPEESEATGGDDGEFECVYAGPEYFEQLEKERLEKERHEAAALGPDVPSVGGVYAGPQYFESAPPTGKSPMGMGMMLVYAGPEYFRKRAEEAKMPAWDGEFETDENGNVICPCCGEPVMRTSRFCPECGAVNPGYLPEAKNV